MHDLQFCEDFFVCLFVFWLKYRFKHHWRNISNRFHFYTVRKNIFIWSGGNKTRLIDFFTRCNLVLCCITVMSFSNIYNYVWPVVYAITFVNLCLWNNNYTEILLSYADVLWTRISDKAARVSQALGVDDPLEGLLLFSNYEQSVKLQPHRFEFNPNKVGKQHYLILCSIFTAYVSLFHFPS